MYVYVCVCGGPLGNGRELARARSSLPKFNVCTGIAVLPTSIAVVATGIIAVRVKQRTTSLSANVNNGDAR